MNMHFDILSMSEGQTVPFNQKGFIFLIVLSGDCILHSNVRPDIQLQTLDALRFNPEEDYSFTPKSHTLIGIIHITDYSSTISDFFVEHTNYNAYIKNAFLYAIDVQSIELPNKQEIMSSLYNHIWNILLGMGIRALKTNPMIEQLAAIIREKHTDTEFDLAQTIEYLGYSAGHLRRIFKEQTGMPPLEFLTNLRIETAKKLLRENTGKISIKDIAFKSGYTDQNYFSKQFKKHEGMSPQEYYSHHANP